MLRRLTLGHVFYLTLAGLGLLLAVLFTVVLEGSRRSIVRSSEQLREAWSDRIDDALLRGLGRAEDALLDLERQLQSGTCRPEAFLSVESCLYAALLNDPELAEVTLTRAPRPDERGAVWQVSVFREGPEEGSPIVTRRTAAEGGRFVSAVRTRPKDGGFRDTPLVVRPGEVADPSGHSTFVTPTTRAYGRLVWTDLSWSEVDLALPEDRRRVVLTAMKTLEDREGRFLGVLRVGSRAEQVDRVVQMPLASGGGEDPHRKFLFDGEGRLVTRLSPADRLTGTAADALRVAPAALPPEVAAALRHPLLARLGEGRPRASGTLEADGRRFLVSFRTLADAEGRLPEGGIWDWRIGIVVPEEAYLAGLVRTRNLLLGGAGAVMGLILAGGTLAVRAVRRGLARIVGETARLRRFEFSPAAPLSPFADVRETMEALEQAKTAMRAMGKYVPVELVRELYAANREPVLGGRLQDATLMFTDIEGFTSLAEGLVPDRLAERLGLYLEAMTAAVHATGGTVDKYIGDAVMALWNAPRPQPDHAARACRAALGCLAATEALYASPAWGGRPPLVTRIGLHRDSVLVGHFGAPDRMSYTALGDGVNLASRLEGLNKQYGSRLLASEAVREAAGESFVFRRLDRVAVKGKTQGTLVHELLGETGSVPAARIETARAYESGLDAYFAGDFAAGLGRFEGLPDDPPARALAARCRSLLAEPPAGPWTGVYLARSK